MFGAYRASVFDHRVAERLALRVGPAAVQVDTARTGRRCSSRACPAAPCPGSIIDGNDDVHVRVARELAVLRVVVGALEVLDARADRDRAARARIERPIAVREAGEVAAARSARGSPCPTSRGTCSAPLPSTRSSGSSLRSTSSQERAPRIEARDDDRRARSRRRSSSATPVARPSFTSTRSTAASVRISAPSARAALRDRFADRAGAALLKAPRAKRAVDLAHVVMQQHVRRARRARPEKRADDAARRLRRLERIELEPLVEIVGAAHRHELVQRVEALGAERRASGRRA